MQAAPSQHSCKSQGRVWLQVYKGLYKDQTVAVKVCRKANLNASAMRQFQKEVAILQGCRHENLVSFIGACTWKASLLTDCKDKHAN